MTEFSVDHCSFPTEELADLFRNLDLIGQIQRGLARSVREGDRCIVLKEHGDYIGEMICFFLWRVTLPVQVVQVCVQLWLYDRNLDGDV